MRAFALPACIFAAALAVVSAQALLVLDRVMDGDLVESVNVTVTYTIHNVGDSPANNIILKDISFPASRFTLFHGSPKRTYDTLSAGESHQLSITLSPKRSGHLIVSPASVSYESEGSKHVSRLATDDTLTVEDILSWKRRTDKHVKEWLAYLAALLVMGAGPLGVSRYIEHSLCNSAKKKS